MTFEKHEVADYEKKRYRGLDQRLVHNREERILRKIFSKIGDAKGLALDLPCGYGRFSAFLLGRGFSLVNSDLSFHMVERANERTASLTRSYPRGTVADAACGLPFKDSVFSVVFSMRLFHHIHHSRDRVKILQEFARVSSTWIVLSYYQSNALHKIQRKYRRQIKKTPTRIKMITRREFQEETRGCDLDIVKILPLFRGLHAQNIVLIKKART
jgi:SAM-dependent methyltransferase